MLAAPCRAACRHHSRSTAVATLLLSALVAACGASDGAHPADRPDPSTETAGTAEPAGSRPAGEPSTDDAAAARAEPGSGPTAEDAAGGQDATGTAASRPAAGPTGLWALPATSLAGEEAPLSRWAGQVALVVNVASECGYTPQYAGLQELAETYADRGFVVLGFPSNEFGGQEPGTPEQIRAFCSERFGVTFPLFAKCVTQPGAEQSPVYRLLEETTGEVPGWNFCKYLVGRDGEPIAFYPSRVAPDDAELTAAIEKAL